MCRPNVGKYIPVSWILWVLYIYILYIFFNRKSRLFGTYSDGKKTLRKDSRSFLICYRRSSPPASPPEIDCLMIRAFVKTVDWFPWPNKAFVESLFLEGGRWRGVDGLAKDVSPDEAFKRVDPTFGTSSLFCRKMPRQSLAIPVGVTHCFFCCDFLPRKNWFRNM